MLSQQRHIAIIAAALLAGCWLLASQSVQGQDPPCIVPIVNGTVDLPPADCCYVSPQQFHIIVQGLPPGTNIRVAATHRSFLLTRIETLKAGSGDLEQFSSIVDLSMTGGGLLAGFTKFISLQAQVETRTGSYTPLTPSNPTQTFSAKMVNLEGEIPPGDPIFSSFKIEAGEAHCLASPGKTTLALRSIAAAEVSSEFEIHYRISYEGTLSGPLHGMSGISEGVVKMKARRCPDRS